VADNAASFLDRLVLTTFELPLFEMDEALLLLRNLFPLSSRPMFAIDGAFLLFCDLAPFFTAAVSLVDETFPLFCDLLCLFETAVDGGFFLLQDTQT